MSITILDSTTVDGTLLISSISNSATDTDRFVVSDGGVLKYRTGTQVRSDIGAGTGNGTVTSVGGTGTVSGLTLSGTVTSSGNLTLGGTLALTSANVTTALGYTPYNSTNPAGYITDGNTGWTNTYGFITASSTNTLTNKSGNISQWTNDSGYTTNVGDITGVTAGTGISGGGTSGTVTITNSDRGSSQNIFKNVAVSGQSSIVADNNNDTLTFAAGNNITLSTNAATDTLTITANINPGDITGVTAGTGLSGGGTSGTVTLSIDSTVATLTGTQTFTNKSGNISQWTNDSGYTTNVGDITGVTAGTGLSGGGTSGTVTLNCTIDSPSEVGLGNLSSSGNSLSGNFTATGNITAYSDERLKTDVETIPNALEKVNSLRGVTFDKDGVRGLGVIAQEVEKILPEVVMDGEEFKSVAYGNIVGVLIEAIKELTAEVEYLKKQIK